MLYWYWQMNCIAKRENKKESGLNTWWLQSIEWKSRNVKYIARKKKKLYNLKKLRAEIDTNLSPQRLQNQFACKSPQWFPTCLFKFKSNLCHFPNILKTYRCEILFLPVSFVHVSLLMRVCMCLFVVRIRIWRPLQKYFLQ